MSALRISVSRERAEWLLIVHKNMILDIILDFFKTHLPLIMAVVYLYGYEKNKIENLVKFFVLRTMLSVVEFIFVKLFLFDL